MICATCGAETPEVVCATCGQPALLAGRYALAEILSERPGRTAWRADDQRSAEPVVVVEHPMRRGVGSDVIHRVEEAAAGLRQLPLAHGPCFLDAFMHHGARRALILVHEYTPGRSLALERADHDFTEAETLRVLEAVLLGLGELHERGLVHGSVYPGHVVRRGTDGRLFLVGLTLPEGLLRMAVGEGVRGERGYMPPEQLAGVESQAADLYAVGALGIALLTGREPRELVDAQNRLRFTAPGVSAGTRKLLQELVSVDPSRRPTSADVVLARVRSLRGVGAAGAGEADPWEQTIPMYVVDGELTQTPPSKREASAPWVPPWMVYVVMAVSAVIVIGAAITLGFLL